MISIHALLAESDKRANSFPHAPPQISIHALLAESDVFVLRKITITVDISIHALLAESDLHCKTFITFRHYFYPRSPCGERLKPPVKSHRQKHFYPRSPCGERLVRAVKFANAVLFLSTLSLRRATIYHRQRRQFPAHFYPRSPCGERPVLNA